MDSSEQSSLSNITHAPWQREFFKNVEVFTRLGIPEERARELLTKYLRMAADTPLPDVLKSLNDPSKLEEVGVYTPMEPTRRKFVVEFFDPFIRNFDVEGLENLNYIMPLIGKFPLVLISNHLSHLDAPAIFLLLNRLGGDAQNLANKLVFVAGRLVFEPDFTRLGLYMFDTLLVCSKADMNESPTMADIMTRINMRAFRQSVQLQKEGKVICIFPEGTRSRTGRLVSFVETVYHYVANKVVIPISLSGTEEILPTTSFMFNAAKGKMTIGRPILTGDLSMKQMAELPNYVQRMSIPESPNKKEFVIDNLALIVGGFLQKHRHGIYRNLFRGDSLRDDSKNILIKAKPNPEHKIVIIGHSTYGIAIANILANKDASIQILVTDPQKAIELNEANRDLDHFPLYKLPPNIKFTSDPETILGATLLIQAARPWELDAYYGKWAELIQKTNAPVVSVVKGFTGSEKSLVLDDLSQIYGIESDRLAVLAGANYPEQVLERKITGYELAAVNPGIVERILPLFNTGYVFSRSAANPSDVRGVQLGGALKNIYAIGTGLIDGFFAKRLGGNNDNSLFHVSNRMFREMCSIGVALGGMENTFFGLSGHSDLMLACFGQDSRARQIGYDFVYGRDSKQENSGIFGLNILPRLIELDPANYPVATAIHSIIVEGKDISTVIAKVSESLRRYEGAP